MLIFFSNLGVALVLAIGFWGVGWVMEGLSPRNPFPRLQFGVRQVLRLVWGFTTWLLTLLVFRSAWLSLVLLGCLAGFTTWRRRSTIGLVPRMPSISAHWGGAPWFLLVFSFLCIAILLERLDGWDSRSIWFFHAKMIYFSGGFYRDAGWADVANQFSHPFYPKLFPVLGASAAWLTGFWNDYVPKIGLLILAYPVVYLTFFVPVTHVARVYLMYVLIGSGGDHLWSGYMDAYCALYSSLGIMALWKEESDPDAGWLQAAVLFFGVAANLKQEGFVFAVLVLCFKFRWRWIRQNMLCLIPLIAAAWWIFLSRVWHLPHWVTQSETSFLYRISHRSFSDFSLIWRFFNDAAVCYYFAIFGAVAFVWLGWVYRRWLPMQTLRLGGVASLAFLGVLLLTYLGTPWDLHWHLVTSIDRVIMIPTACAAVIGGMALDEIWKVAKPSAGSQRT